MGRYNGDVSHGAYHFERRKLRSDKCQKKELRKDCLDFSRAVGELMR